MGTHSKERINPSLYLCLKLCHIETGLNKYCVDFWFANSSSKINKFMGGECGNIYALDICTYRASGFEVDNF